MMLRRHEVITRVAYDILASFHGQEICTTVTRHGGEDKHLGKGKGKALAEQQFGPSLAKEMLAARKQFKGQAQRECFQCKVLERDSQRAFKSCAKCNTIGRIVLYCSR